MRNVLTEKHLEDALTRDGYLIIDFLGQDELDEIRRGTAELGFGLDNQTKLRMSVVQGSDKNRHAIFERFSPVFQLAINRFLQNYKLIRVGIFDKLPGGKIVRVHQHPNLVNESKYRSVTIWMPLTDTTVEMGTLHVVKGSHEFSNHIRSYDDYFDAFERVSSKVMTRYSTPLTLKLGQAVIFDDRLIHWSPPNKSSRIRTAFQLISVPEEAELTIYFRANRQELSKYAISKESYKTTQFTHGKPDYLKEIEKVNQPAIIYNDREFISMMQKNNPGSLSQKKNFFERLLGL